MLQHYPAGICKTWSRPTPAVGCRPALMSPQARLRRPAKANSTSGESRPVMMPDGAWYMISHDFHQPLYGNGFVISREERGVERASGTRAPGLVVYKHGGQLAVRPMSEPGDIVTVEWQEVALAAVAEPGEMKLVPFGTTIDAPSAVTIAPQDGSMMGMVLSAAVRPRPEPTLPMVGVPIHANSLACKQRVGAYDLPTPVLLLPSCREISLSMRPSTPAHLGALERYAGSECLATSRYGADGSVLSYCCWPGRMLPRSSVLRLSCQRHLQFICCRPGPCIPIGSTHMYGHVAKHVILLLRVLKLS